MTPMHSATGTMSLFLGLSLSLLLGLAAWLDIRHRRIPNTVVVAVALLWLPYATGGGLLAVAAAVVTAVVALGVGIAVWRLGWLGGGDVKLVAALSLWAGPAHTPELLLVIALGGGVLAMAVGAAQHPMLVPIVTLVQIEAARRLPAIPGLNGRSRIAIAPATGAATGMGTIPYGVAVAFGGAWLLHRLFLA